MAVSALLATSRVVDEENVEPQGHSQPIDSFCYGLCSNTFGDADCFALCKAKQFKDGNCIVQTQQLQCCCSR
ncbi:hypothetical protein Pyn_34566 [Prunus yedoensis var. nudiflora]|uniref:Defensin-like domain-containing protein n=1 Tax=Prunus yedoensis var. nudiflora TaxID=2094558 RepID=A0A314YSC8_PRUYE|nr:hypothetical protein Pyn_34566 [Prunus yedoensis var. nudiflora]